MIINADARFLPIADESVSCVVTSPPYWGLRDYGIGPDALGLEPTLELYVQHMVEIFREVRRVLRKDGTVWLNLGDSYAGSLKGIGADGVAYAGAKQATNSGSIGIYKKRPPSAASVGLKPKDLCMIPARVALALQADGWWLRSDIVWAKPNPMPESVTDRPTRAHEYIFLLTKSARYWYDAAAIRESATPSTMSRLNQKRFHEQNGGAKDYGDGSNRSSRRALENLKAKADKQRGHSRKHAGFNGRWDRMPKAEQQALGCNKRDVWWIAAEPFPDAHFATFPEKLIEPCIKAGCPVGGVVLDPFGGGSGRVHKVALGMGRRAIATELKFDYCLMAMRQRQKDHPLFVG